MMIFNLRSNPILSQVTNYIDDKKCEIIDYDDSIHLFIPIIINSYLVKNKKVLIKLLKKNNFSINGLVWTNDNKIIEIVKQQSHAFNHVINNTPIISSFNELILKISLLSNTLYVKECIELNNRLNNITFNNKFNEDVRIKISFLELMKLCGLKFYNTKFNHNLPLSIPGGHIDKKDTSIEDTVLREIKEEINVKDIVLNNKYVIYHNIFDKINEKFYHNLIVKCNMNYTSSHVKKTFKSNYEIENIQITDIRNFRFKSFKHILDGSKN